MGRLQGPQQARICGVTKCVRKAILGRRRRNSPGRRTTIKSDMGQLGSNSVVSGKRSFSRTEFWQLCLRNSFLPCLGIYSQQLPLTSL